MKVSEYPINIAENGEKTLIYKSETFKVVSYVIAKRKLYTLIESIFLKSIDQPKHFVLLESKIFMNEDKSIQHENKKIDVRDEV